MIQMPDWRRRGQHCAHSREAAPARRRIGPTRAADSAPRGVGLEIGAAALVLPIAVTRGLRPRRTADLLRHRRRLRRRRRFGGGGFRLRFTHVLKIRRSPRADNSGRGAAGRRPWRGSPATTARAAPLALDRRDDQFQIAVRMTTGPGIAAASAYMRALGTFPQGCPCPKPRHAVASGISPIEKYYGPQGADRRSSGVTRCRQVQ